ATTADNTANAGSDYTTSSQLLTFNAGETTKNFAVPILGDTTFESNESFTVNLTGNSAGTALGASSGTGTINNDDTQPSISINDVTQLETNGNTNFVFDVTLSNASSQTITVNFATADNGATAGSDYTMTSNTLTFNAGEVAKQITVVVTGDATDEPNEQFFVNLSGPSNATLADAQGIGTIINDDSPTPTFSIDSISQNEGNAGTTAFNFTVTLSPVSASATSVNVATSNGTALILDGDYISNSTTLNFPANSPSQQFTVFVNGDTKFEPNETFTATLTSPSAGTQLGLASGTATITNDDAQPSLSINDVSQNEGNAGTTNFPFTVSLSNASFQTITVDYATANGSATADSDYTATSGTITFNSGETSKPLPVSVNGDGTIEGNETFVINLTNPTNASLLDAQGTGTIVEDDSAMPSFSIANVTLNEGNSGTTSFTFTVTLSPTAGSTTTVQATIADGTATSADGDFVALAPVTLTFNAGVATQQVTVNVNGDTKLENNETFTVTLGSNSAGTTIGSGTATGTITNDDAQPQMLISDPSQFEGNSGTTAFLFTVTLSNPSAFPITVNYLTSNGTATAGSDYTTTSGTLTFPPGSTTQTITVLVNGDLLNEGSETFFMTLSNASGATISDAQATATIQNDPEDAAATATVPMLGARELALLAIALAVVAMTIMKR
ncbi:MAG: Calx-beta domain-containing protein, partial [Thermoanaerobaculia bacterium]